MDQINFSRNRSFYSLMDNTANSIIGSIYYFYYILYYLIKCLVLNFV